MSDRYSVFDDDFGMEINTYYLSQSQALKMAMDLLDEGSEEVTIVNMENHIKGRESNEN